MAGGCMSGMFGRRTDQVRLFAYPGQSNMTGRRLPLSWPAEIRASPQTDSANTFILLDAAALATTAPLNNVFRNPATAPDFTCVSFYKIFGFPDLGGLIIRKNPATMRILASRRYFGGGSVDMVTVLGDDAFHAKKTINLHSSLEDGTLPFHSIIALGTAIDTHEKLFGSMAQISSHTAALVRELYTGLTSLRHSNGLPVARIYNEQSAMYGDARTQGAAIALNIQRPDGSIIAPSAVETAANAAHIYLRSGSLCNPGGAAAYLEWSGAGLRQLYAEGLRCGAPSEIHAGKPVGLVRASLGTMSILADVEAFVTFLREQYVDCMADCGAVPEAMSYDSSTKLDFGDSEKHAPQAVDVENQAGWSLFRCCL
ncbi:uncharacterized protein K452DRAFT_292531 [Aplosporella prunicola CBS 121167]|uniref:Aminotransferase class V domain-containing protein n=1 Tax=Aplosporella prunicola CBS 121167 TaxID=1176127 RepID=A0A6A6AYJ3_9PEZI|nr:uncharacterized protein K452DRAFT_292531 [Aplosporella prunicola CBS 121167]KAF2136253.1 hypothetical protein K452DRAFT_292531 [Aplosporella prunicola CBS 121167]